MKIVTFNLRCDPPIDGINAFSNRKGRILDKIECAKPDIIGFQEARPHMHAFLKAHLAQYELFGRQRGDTWSESGPIAYRKDKFELISLNTQWLSPTPNVPASRYEKQSICPRIFTHAVLESLLDHSLIHVINTHLDHEFAEARLLGAEQLIGYMRAILAVQPYPLVLMGDLNAFPDEECIRRLLADDALCLTDCARDIDHSFHGFGLVTQPRIDYIFSRGFEEISPAEAWMDNWEGIYLSDHYPVEVNLRPGK